MAGRRAAAGKALRAKRGGGGGDSAHWIEDAHMEKGAFKNQAKRAGMSTKAFEAKSLKKGSHASAKTKRRARTARTLQKLRPK